jgi:ABC-type uncharacterized transport system involved in gliding motility auxiliary subunit
LSGGVLAALALLFIGLTVLFNHVFRGWRADLTENDLYTIAPGSERILEGLGEPINLYFFYSQESAGDLPELKTYGTRVRELLEELAARSNGRLRLSVIDPEPYSEDEDRAAELGVQGAPVGPDGTNVYFGLAGTNSTDGREAIGFFDPRKEEFLEYDIVRLVHSLANPERPVIGWMSTLPMGGAQMFDPRTGQAREPPLVYSQAEQLFDVRQVSTSTTAIEPDIDVLAMVHPKGLSPATQFAVDQFALRGGKILMFVDPVAEADESGADPSNPMAPMMANRSSDAGALLKAWGVDFKPGEVVGDAEYALQVGMQPGAAPVRHLGILGLREPAFNAEDVVAADLASVNVATVGRLEALAGAKTSFEPLIQSSAQAGILPAGRFTMLFDPDTLREGFKPTGERYALAARVTGSAGTAFPDGPPEGAKSPEGGALAKSAKPLNVIVVADTDVLQDYLWVRRQSFFGQPIAQAWAGNGDLVANALDNLSGSSDLISVRGRATFTRPFDRVEALRRRAEERFRTTEQKLEQELRTTEERLTQLQSQGNEESALILTPEQERELERFRQEKLRIRKELRDVRLGLNQDIDRLGTTLKVLNIVVAPALVAGAALGAGFWRRRRRGGGTGRAAAQAQEKAGA